MKIFKQKNKIQFFLLFLITLGHFLNVTTDKNKIHRVHAQSQTLFLSYPPNNHKTVADSIFLIGSAPSTGKVLVNGKSINRSPQGFFAPSFPLKMGTNKFTIRYQNKTVTRTITKLSTEPEFPKTLGFAKNSLTPSKDIARLPNELICFGAIAPPDTKANVILANQNLPLMPLEKTVELQSNSAALISENEPLATRSSQNNTYQQVKGCMSAQQAGIIGNPTFELIFGNKTVKQKSPAQITILSPNNLEVVQVVTEAGVARTGPSTTYSRLTPLPRGTKASVTGREGEWLRLDYGGWIKAEETRTLSNNIPPETMIRSLSSRVTNDKTEIIFPLQNQVPIAIKQDDETFTITLYNTTAQTDTIRFDDNPLIKRLDWQQVAPKQVEYTFNLKSEQQWGYDVRYQGTNLILSLNHQPKLSTNGNKNLNGISILLDPGHGGKELGAVGPNGIPEKDVNLIVSKLLAKELTQKGAKVYLTRETDKNVSLGDRVKMINNIKPTLALSVHYNALPDAGDAINTKGIGMFWYHPQAHDLAVFLHHYLVENLDRPSYGVFWNNLALTRPHTAPTILLELGFMINPNEFEWIINPREQQKLASAIADGVTAWLDKQNQ